jgi:beta-glucanase (GH16 family)
VQTFADEFNSTGLDTSVWNDAIWYESSNATKNYAVEDGKLKIWPQRDGSGNFFNRTIDTDGKFYQTYGYFEMEAKLPKGKGTWPAFWLFNHDGGGNYRPEIDILEAYAGGGPNSGWSDAALNPTAYAGTVWVNGIANGGGMSKTFQNLGDLSAGFHKYGLKWEPNKITFYFDGKEVYSANASMGERMYIILDLWYGSASGDPDGSTPTGKGNAYEIKYVRGWQFK